MTVAPAAHAPAPSPSAPTTSSGSIAARVAAARAAFDSGRTRPLAWRMDQLDALRRMISTHEDAILRALAEDLGKPAIEGYTTEVGYALAEVAKVKKGLPAWIRPERAPTPLILQPAKSRIYREPLGVVLIIAPWNYPFQLAVAPLIGAIAAGNCTIVKPSEVAPATSALIAELVPRYLDRECVQVIEGGVAETTELLAERFDHIFYTGNGAVGRIVMTAAARHLTPVTLELGGKSPTIVDATANLEVAARRICWAKFTNAGQTCVAPDYVLVEESVHDKLLARMKATIRDFYGEDPRQSPDYGRVINARHHRRLVGLMKSGAVVIGGEADEGERYIAPTVLRDVDPSSPIMQEEIFGPILPVLKVRGVDQAISMINARPKPLALYVFTESRAVAEDVLARTSSGGAVVNHAIMHLANADLPFGGVGESGMGAYHGRSSFELFSHHRSVLKKPSRIDPSIAYPPYDAGKQRLLRRLF